MKKLKILHNPEAGGGAPSKRDLIKMIESAGFKCSYSSTKGNCWENIESEIDMVVLAGGDGTVRKIAGLLLDRKMLDKNLPIGLLPLGTANNIANTLGLSDVKAEIIQDWHRSVSKEFDVGVVNGLDQPSFFLESLGYGLFPKLIQEMKNRKKNDIDDPKKKLEAALKMLHKLILSATVKKCSLQIDGKDYSGEFLLIEVMNIRSIGPNLSLAPDADPGDGEFDVVFITEGQREGLAAYVQKKIEGKEVVFEFPVLKGKDLKIFWDGKHAHVDDEYHKLEKPVKINIELRKGLLEFLVPPKEGRGTRHKEPGSRREDVAA